MSIGKVAIVGCGGFVGAHLTRELLRLGIEVDGWDLYSHRIDDLFTNPLLTFHLQDYASAAECQRIATSASVVIHLAAICTPGLYNTEDERVIHSNAFHPALLADACAANQTHLVYFSTSEVYGKTLTGHLQDLGETHSLPENADILQEDHSPLLLGPVQARRWSYAAAKQLSERYIVALGEGRGLPYSIIRPFNFLGPQMDFLPGIDGEGLPRVMACFMDALLHQRPMQLVDGGMRKRAFTWIGDAIYAIVLLLQQLSSCNKMIFNIGNPSNECTIFELAQNMSQIYQELGGSLAHGDPWQSVSALEFYGVGYQDSDRRLPDIRKAQQILQWMPQVGLQDTLRQTMRWYMDHYKGKL